MKYLKTLFTFLAFSNIALACNVSLFSRIYIVKPDNLTMKDLVKASDCSRDVNSKIFNFLKSGRGTITSAMLLEHVLDSAVTIEPQKIVVEDFTSFLERSLNFTSDRKIISLSLVTGAPTVSLLNNQFLSSTCSECTKPGNSTAKLNITNALENTNTTQWINIQVGVRAHVFKAASNIPAFTKIENNGLLLEEDIYTSEPAKFASSFSELKYRQIVRPVQKGQPIKLTSTMPYAVVKSGETIKIITKSSNISIETTGICLEQGHVDQLIRIKNLNSNKIFSAKIVDKNTARIDL